MKKLSYSERQEMAKLFENWLSIYTEEVIEKVMRRYEEIVENEFVMNILKELYERDNKEKEDRIDSFEFMIRDAEESKFGNTWGVHNNCITHAHSYRDILYDMYIR